MGYGACSCQKRSSTNEQFMQHITEDVLPPLLDCLSRKRNHEAGASEAQDALRSLTNRPDAA
jgi:hypothetical protein